MLASEEGEEPEVFYTIANGGYKAPPCRTGEGCPKGSPEDEERFILHPLCLDIYRRYQTHRRESWNNKTPEENDDELLEDCYRIIHNLTEQAAAESDSQRQAIATLKILYPAQYEQQRRQFERRRHRLSGEI